MNIYCEWTPNNTGLIIYSGNRQIGGVEESYGEPCLKLCDYQSLTFSEIEHIMDNWFNLPKN